MSDYDNVYLIPKNGCSPINSRSQVSLNSSFFDLYPIISSPMKAISGTKLVIGMAKNNCLGILHRFDTPEQRVKNIHEIAKENVKFGIAIGVNNFLTELDIASCAFEHGAVLICVDCANGYMSQLENVANKLINRFGKDIKLMAGNVITKNGANYLSSCGYDFIRIGIGSGSLCTTRNVTGIGRNNLFAINDCQWESEYIVADGGIYNSGHASKCFAFGADMIMLGGMLAYSLESEGTDTIFGMASEKLHREESKTIKSIEGTELKIDPSRKKPLKEILDQFLWGIKSTCSYLGCSSYKEIQEKSLIVPVNELF
jgi:IMP dehydrogenase/GMP reductase